MEKGRESSGKLREATLALALQGHPTSVTGHWPGPHSLLTLDCWGQGFPQTDRLLTAVGLAVVVILCGTYPGSHGHYVRGSLPLCATPMDACLLNSPSMAYWFYSEAFRLPLTPNSPGAGILICFSHSFIHITILIIFSYGLLSRY